MDAPIVPDDAYCEVSLLPRICIGVVNNRQPSSLGLVKWSEESGMGQAHRSFRSNPEPDNVQEHQESIQF